MTIRRQVVWWNVQRLLRPTGRALSRALNATAADGWTRATFDEKVARCAATLRQLTGGIRPAMVALAEVADDNLAARLIEESELGLQVVREKASTMAGADLVLLIDPDLFTTVGEPIAHNVSNRFTTRDVYEVRLEAVNGVPLVVLLCHWPSRLISNSGSLRIAAADWTRRLVEQHLKFPITAIVDSQGRRQLPPLADLDKRARTPLLVLGDFNDSPYDTSVDEVLGCIRDPARALASLSTPTKRTGRAVDTYLSRRIRLVNPCWPLLMGTPGGSTYWNGQWWLLDQVIHSAGMLPGAHRTPGEAGIDIVADSIQLKAPRSIDVLGRIVPWCSPAGVPLPYDPRTRKGVSDHLPLLFEIDIYEA